MGGKPDSGKLIGMSIALPRLDLEAAVAALATLGFDAVEVYLGQIGPGIVPPVTLFEGNAAAAGTTVRAAGLMVSTLNVVGDLSFDPFSGPARLRSTSEELGKHLRMAAAMGAPRVLIWEGRAERAEDVRTAPRVLAECISRARELSRLPDPPEISVELHPYTFGLKHHLVPELAAALRSIDAGICLDFCHFGVALGPQFIDSLDDAVIETVNHVHFADTDCHSWDFHYPPGDGRLDLQSIGRRLSGRDVAIAWDLFGWPGPRAAMRDRLPAYRDFVQHHGASLAVEAKA